MFEYYVIYYMSTIFVKTIIQFILLKVQNRHTVIALDRFLVLKRFKFNTSTSYYKKVILCLLYTFKV